MYNFEKKPRFNSDFGQMNSDVIIYNNSKNCWINFRKVVREWLTLKYNEPVNSFENMTDEEIVLEAKENANNIALDYLTQVMVTLFVLKLARTF